MSVLERSGLAAVSLDPVSRLWVLAWMAMIGRWDVSIGTTRTLLIGRRGTKVPRSQAPQPAGLLVLVPLLHDHGRLAAAVGDVPPRPRLDWCPFLPHLGGPTGNQHRIPCRHALA